MVDIVEDHNTHFITIVASVGHNPTLVITTATFLLILNHLVNIEYKLIIFLVGPTYCVCCLSKRTT